MQHEILLSTEPEVSREIASGASWTRSKITIRKNRKNRVYQVDHKPVHGLTRILSVLSRKPAYHYKSRDSTTLLYTRFSMLHQRRAVPS